MEDPLKVIIKNPYESVGFFKRLFVLWIIPLFRKGWARDLELQDLYRCPKSEEPEFFSDILEQKWEDELKNAKIKNRQPNLVVATIKAFAPQFFKTVWFMFFTEGIGKCLQPLLIGIIVRYLSGEIEMYESAKYAMIGLLTSTFCMIFMAHHGFAFHMRLGNNMRSAFTNIIYKKMLKMSKSSFEKTDMGTILNILANDLNRFEDLGWMLIFMFIAPSASIIALVITFNCIGFSTFAGFIIIILFVPFQGYMGRLFTRFRSATTIITDKRVNLMSEIISAMKLIKVYCWERSFAEIIGDIREDEINRLKKTYYLEGVNSSFFFVGAKLILFASFICFVLNGGKLTTEIVFVCMSVINAMRVPVTRIFPNAIGIIGESLVSLRRINNLLLAEEKPELAIDSRSKSLAKGSIVYENFIGRWTSKASINSLDSISLHVNPGELLIVVGTVGAGKTCLLYSILNEIHQISGTSASNGKISFASQDTWCFGGSIKQNIALSENVDRKKYSQVIKCCGLERDIELFDLGDDQFVGEKGYNLSGGQKARVSLARAVYFDADIYLLDDPLSAVDPKVANHIFEKCIQTYLKGKTVVLVTHQLQFVSRADKIAVMKEGKLTSFGTYDDLSQNDPNFNSFLQKQKKEEERKDTMKRQMSLSVKSMEIEVENEAKKKKDNELRELDALKRQEMKGSGSVGFKVIKGYFMSGGNIFFVTFCMVMSLASNSVFMFTDMWLAAWTDTETIKQSYIPPINVTNYTLPSSQSMAVATVFSTTENNIIFYGILMIILFTLTFIRMMAISRLCLKCSINLHNMIFQRIMQTNMDFFEKNPLGRILNRFTRDLSIIDTIIPRTVMDLNLTIMDVLGCLVLSSIINIYLLIPAVALGLMSYPVREFYVRTARDFHRLDSLARSPVYNQVAATSDGLITIRAFKLEEKFKEQFIIYMKDSVSTRFCVFYAIRIFGITLDIFSIIYIMCVGIVLIESPPGTIPGGDGSLILSQSLTLLGLFQYCMRTTSDFENQMISAERVQEYGKLTTEGVLRVHGKTHNKNWPSKGQITFKGVFLRYSAELPPVLKNVSFKVNAGDKIGVVGRTGAGKSSLISVLFRLVEPEGHITIDGVDIQTIGLHDLREKISIIPQDPSLFSGTVRINLDPFNDYSDDKVWEALSQAHLSYTIKNMGGLDGEVTEGGSNMSIGQRQLLCLARSLLKKNRVLVMDEATANVDLETDELIQRTIKVTFKEYTVLTVAHRLNTIIDMDKVLVMDSGQVVEYDHPHRLLQDEMSTFYSMVKQTGPEFEQHLHSLAQKSYYEKETNLYKS